MTMLEDSPERVDLTGLLHGHPGTDETGDQAAGQREARKGAGVKTARSARVHLLV